MPLEDLSAVAFIHISIPLCRWYRELHRKKTLILMEAQRTSSVCVSRSSPLILILFCASINPDLLPKPGDVNVSRRLSLYNVSIIEAGKQQGLRKLEGSVSYTVAPQTSFVTLSSVKACNIL
ncbi:hypothetical protein PoB_004740000 [Plakobranchus ocellatus]|uniref:Uncharacterized protein n=1 Tax=Plakobranchus ocellatus TaxID=259542 RepID=A0AAV4BP49_9GAST|nr:hypothetical protein PoB_004740000 [Plakobranchus ocellatus]